MHPVILLRERIGQKQASALKRAGVRTVMRQCGAPAKGGSGESMSCKEAALISQAGLTLGAVCMGADARAAMDCAERLGQPRGSALYFDVDPEDPAWGSPGSLVGRLKSIKSAVGGQFLVGVRAESSACEALIAEGVIDLFWLRATEGGEGGVEFLASQRWALSEFEPRRSNDAGLTYAPIMVNPAVRDFGQFSTLSRAPFLKPVLADEVRSVFAISAAAGAELHTRPDDPTETVGHMARGTYVFLDKLQGRWAEVTPLNGLGAGGFVRAEVLEPVFGGWPLKHETATTPFEVALKELEADKRDVLEGRRNPRIFQYHATTASGGRDPVDWASSFVNFCVEAAGVKGTGSKWSLTWCETSWGYEVSGDVRAGDLAVWECRKGVSSGALIGGYVGFVTELSETQVTVLGARGGGRIGIYEIPLSGAVGDVFYQHRGFRREGECA